MNEIIIVKTTKENDLGGYNRNLYYKRRGHYQRHA